MPKTETDNRQSENSSGEIVGKPYTLVKDVLVCFHQRGLLAEIYRLSRIQKTVYEQGATENMILTIKTNLKNYTRIKKLLNETRGHGAKPSDK